MGNFDRNSRVPVSPPPEDRPSTEDRPPTDETMQSGYYMLDILNFDKLEAPAKPVEPHSNTPQQYENIANFQRAGQTTPPLITPPKSMSDSLPRKQISSPKPGESSQSNYENILPPQSEEQPPPVPKKVRSKSSLEATKTSSENEKRSKSLLEATKAASENEKRSSLRRRDIVYEAITIGAKSSTSPTNEASPIPASESDQQTLAEPDSATLKRISTSSDPFAGLVISASTAAEDSSPPMETSEKDFRNRTETVWDNERVELEWSQVCC